MDGGQAVCETSFDASEPFAGECVFRSGDIESWGRGYRRIVRGNESAGLLPPIVETEDGLKVTHYVDVTAQVRAMGADERAIPILEHVLKYHKVTNGDVQKMLGVSKPTATRILQITGDMISYTKGDLLSSKAQALVNTVNTVGVMGKGIALHFKELFPYNFTVYAEACKKGELAPGKMLVVKDSNLALGEKLIINFPTKVHWRQPSQYEYIEDGLRALVRVIGEYGITSIAIPPLGCGNGGLDWAVVKEMIAQALSSIDGVEITVYEPSAEVSSLLSKQSRNVQANLTPARAMLLYALFCYEAHDERCSLFVANKLSYFYQMLGEKEFGSYSVSVGHLLNAVNGKYIHGLEQMDAKPFEALMLDYDRKAEVGDYVHNRLSPEQIEHIKQLLKLIDGYESAYSLEVLASVAYVRREHPGISIDETINEIQNWSARKKNLFKQEHIKAAYDRLNAWIV